MVRYKKRYFVLQLEAPEDADSSKTKRRCLRALDLKDDALNAAVKDVIEEMHGDFGRASVATGLRTVYCNPETRLCLIQCRFGPHRIVGSSLPFLTKIKGQRVVPRLVYTGATIKNCYKRMLTFQKDQLRRYRKELDGEVEARVLTLRQMNEA